MIYKLTRSACLIYMALSIDMRRGGTGPPSFHLNLTLDISTVPFHMRFHALNMFLQTFPLDSFSHITFHDCGLSRNSRTHLNRSQARDFLIRSVSSPRKQSKYFP